MSVLGVTNEFLSHHSMFGGLTDEQLDITRTFLHTETFTSGESVLVQGEANNRVYFIIKGSVVVRKKALFERELTTLSVGDSFGEMELIDIQNCAASIVCLSDVVTVTLSHYDLHRLYTAHPEIFTMIIMNLARDISRRLRATNDLLAMVNKVDEET